jgi:superfamily II DNA/RNA helicase
VCFVATDNRCPRVDVDGVSHVINFELPNVLEDHVHVIGRTARAGAPESWWPSAAMKSGLTSATSKTEAMFHSPHPAPAAMSAPRSGPTVPYRQPGTETSATRRDRLFRGSGRADATRKAGSRC